MKDQSQSSTYFEEIDLQELLNVLLKNIKFIVSFTLLVSVLTLLISFMFNNVYTSKALLAPTTLNKNIDRFANLSNLAGIEIGEGDPNVDTAIAYINSIQILQELIKNENFLPDLMAAKSWNLKTNTLKYDQSYYDTTNKKWVRDLAPPFQPKPSAQEAFEIFSELINISQDRRTSLVTLSVDHISPFVARQWSIWIAREANEFVANMRVKEAQASIAYLEEQIKLTPYAELKTQFYELIQQNTQSMMLAKVNPEFVLTTIDPPLVAEIKSKPQRFLILFIAFLSSLVVSSTIVLLRYLVFSKEDKLWFSKRF